MRIICMKPLVFETSLSKEIIYRLTVAVRCIDSRDIIIQHLSNFGFDKSISTDSVIDDRLYLDIDSTSDLQPIWRKVRRLSRGRPRFEILSHSTNHHP